MSNVIGFFTVKHLSVDSAAVFAKFDLMLTCQIWDRVEFHAHSRELVGVSGTDKRTALDPMQRVLPMRTGADGEDA
jgi:hypothetical protein